MATWNSELQDWWIIADDGRLTRPYGFDQWAAWMRDHAATTCVVGDDKIGPVCVSTRFIGYGTFPWECGVFVDGVWQDDWGSRHATRIEALREHVRLCRKMFGKDYAGLSFDENGNPAKRAQSPLPVRGIDLRKKD